MCAWRFASTVGENRTRALLEPIGFTAICELVARNMEVICSHRQQCDDNTTFSRVVFNVRVAPSIFDLFFNSPSGYRGAYFLSPYLGSEANYAFVQHLSSSLLECAEAHCPSLDRQFARESLSAPSAKAWLTEYESHLCAKCVGEWGNPTDDSAEIVNGRWELSDSPNGHRGRKAPQLSKIRIYGAFLNERWDEFVPACKRQRATDIHECGWS